MAFRYSATNCMHGFNAVTAYIFARCVFLCDIELDLWLNEGSFLNLFQKIVPYYQYL